MCDKFCKIKKKQQNNHINHPANIIQLRKPASSTKERKFRWKNYKCTAREEGILKEEEEREKKEANLRN